MITPHAKSFKYQNPWFSDKPEQDPCKLHRLYFITITKFYVSGNYISPKIHITVLSSVGYFKIF